LLGLIIHTANYCQGIFKDFCKKPQNSLKVTPLIKLNGYVQ
jgi:hypothetical protein